jgi:hypothetical protein
MDGRFRKTGTVLPLCAAIALIAVSLAGQDRICLEVIGLPKN